MGGYTRSAVAKARVTVLKQYGLTGEVLEEESESSQAEQTIIDLFANNEETGTDTTASTVGQETQAVADSGDIMEEGDAAEDELVQEPSSNIVITVEPTSDNAITVEPSDNPVVVSGESVEIVVAQGDDSAVVSRKLYNAGVIENAAEFDAFLMQHEYDKRINPGTKTILVTDTWQEVAEKLTTK